MALGCKKFWVQSNPLALILGKLQERIPPGAMRKLKMIVQVIS